jgi:hypothetical protein
MSETLDELTYDYEDDGVLVRKQLDRVILAHNISNETQARQLDAEG